MVNTTIEKLNNRNIDIKYKFQNQKLSTLAIEFLKNEFSNLPLSNMNESGDHIFSCDYIRNCQFNGWFSEPESLPSQNNQNPSFVSKPEIYMTDKMMSDQVDILISDVPMYEPVV